MKKVLYDIALSYFPVLLRMIGPFHKKAKLMVDGRKNWAVKLANQKFTGKRIWIHCASLGEFEQGRPLLEQIRNQHSDHAIIVTFFSSSGYEVRKDFEGADYVCYLPFDGQHNARRFIELLNPDLAIFVKYEFWYHYLKELKRCNIPVFSISTIFRPDQQFFKKNGQFFREMLSCFDYFFVQNDQSKQLLNQQGYENVTVSGDTRFDRVTEICANPKEINSAELFKNSEKTMVIGSSWPEDMEVLFPIINNSEIKLKYIIAPHEISPEKIRKMCGNIKVGFQLYSQINDEKLQTDRVLVIDSIGLLSSLYQYGDIAYVGGAFGDGLHNILEAATFGMPIIFGKGKDNHKYQEALDLVDLGGAFEIESSQNISDILDHLIRDGDELLRVSELCKDYVKSKTGATDLIMSHLSKYLD